MTAEQALLVDVELARSRGFAQHEIRELQELVESNAAYLREVWDEFFGA